MKLFFPCLLKLRIAFTVKGAAASKQRLKMKINVCDDHNENADEGLVDAVVYK